MSTIKTLIFDIGNVIFTFNPEEFLQNILGDDKKGSDCFSLMVQSPEWQELDKGLLSIEKAKNIFIQRDPSLKDEVELFFKQWLDMFQPIEPTIKLLDTLREKGYKLYILSNFIRESFEALSPKMIFLQKFDGVVASYSIGMAKPDRDIYEHVLEKFDLNANECVFIDDMQVNVDGAESVGISTILFESTEQLIDQLKKMQVL
jgi:epoxide hydrolase-like predicted phosphatase